MKDVEATKQVLHRVTSWAEEIAHARTNDDAAAKAFVFELLEHPTTREWVSVQVARLMGQVH